MERPNHLHVADTQASSRVTGLGIVIVIHVLAIFGLVVALNQSAVMRKMQEIKATVDQDKTPPKAPPPPPPDLVKPPPPVAIVPEFQVSTAPPPSVTAVKSPGITNNPLRPIGRTHQLPPYPPASLRSGEQGNTLMEVTIGIDGNVSDCAVASTSGSGRLDQAACDYVKSHWRWQPPTLNGVPTATKTRVQVKWSLKDAR